MRFTIEFFGRTAADSGLRELELELPEGSSLADAAAALAAREPRLAWIRRVCRPARNLEYASWDDLVQDGDRIGFIPPVSGGSSSAEELREERCWVAVTDAPLDAGALARFVAGPEMGAVVTFSGDVRRENRGRDVGYLVYEAYRPMAVRELARIARRAVERHGCRIAIFHRLGRLEIGETSVVVAVSCAHRGEAFDACREAIDTLKQTVPIWKREVWEEGDVWIEGPGEAPAGPSV